MQYVYVCIYYTNITFIYLNDIPQTHTYLIIIQKRLFDSKNCSTQVLPQYYVNSRRSKRRFLVLPTLVLLIYKFKSVIKLIRYHFINSNRSPSFRGKSNIC